MSKPPPRMPVTSFRQNIYKAIQAIVEAREALVVSTKDGDVLVSHYEEPEHGTAVSAMAVQLRDVAEFNWGFYTREDRRIHIQPLKGSRRRPPKRLKVWLENRGTRTFEVFDPDGYLTAADVQDLFAATRAKLDQIEEDWICWWAMELQLVKTFIRGDDLVIRMYDDVPHNAYERTVPMAEVFPGTTALGHRPWLKGDWLAVPDPTIGLVQVGPRSRHSDRRMSFDITPFIFEGPFPAKPTVVA